MFAKTSVMAIIFAFYLKNTNVEGLFCVSFYKLCFPLGRKVFMYNLSKVGVRVKDLRKKRGNTQEEISEKLGMNIKTYRAIETGNRVGRIDTLCTIAEYFDVSVDYLLGGEKDIETEVSLEYQNLSKERKELAQKLIQSLIEVLSTTK